MSINSTQARDGELNLNVRIVTRGVVNAALRGDTDDGCDTLKDGDGHTAWGPDRAQLAGSSAGDGCIQSSSSVAVLGVATNDDLLRMAPRTSWSRVPLAKVRTP